MPARRAIESVLCGLIGDSRLGLTFILGHLWCHGLENICVEE